MPDDSLTLEEIIKAEAKCLDRVKESPFLLIFSGYQEALNESPKCWLATDSSNIREANLPQRWSFPPGLGPLCISTCRYPKTTSPQHPPSQLALGYDIFNYHKANINHLLVADARPHNPIRQRHYTTMRTK